MWEYRLGISTRGKGPEDPADEEHIYYGSVQYQTIHSVLGHLRLQPDDIFVDLGCGKGRVVCCAARHKVEEVIGIEYSDELAESAKRNSIGLRGRKSPISIVHAPVEDFDYNRGTVFYMFHPFGPVTLQRVMAKLATILERERRPMRLAYVWPMHESVLRGQHWLAEFDRWEPNDARSGGHRVSFWKTVDEV